MYACYTLTHTHRPTWTAHKGAYKEDSNSDKTNLKEALTQTQTYLCQNLDANTDTRTSILTRSKC